MASETINLRVPPGTKAALNTQAKKAGHATLSDYLRALLVSTTDVPKGVSPLYTATPLSRSHLKTTVSPEEKIAFQKLCDDEGVKPSQALRRQVRIAVRNGPDFCADELLLLRHSSMQLQAIGRNLNQVARRINQDGGETPLRLIKDIQQVIEEHRAAYIKLTGRAAQRSTE